MMMKFMNQLRKNAFWIKDKITGRKVLKHIQDINNHLENNCASNDRQEIFNDLKTHAIQNVNFYKSLKADSSLKDFPIIDKAIIRSKLDDFIADNYSQNKMNKVVTSGSTGLPFKTYQNKDKKNRNTADTIYFAKKSNFNIGSPLAYFKIWNKFNNKSALKQFIENVIPINVVNLSEEAISKEIDNLESKYENISFLGYPSALENIASHINKNRKMLSFKVNSIITMSESLDNSQRELMKKSFKCNNVFSRYSNVENGIIAQQIKPDSSDFMINTSSFIVEILNEKNENVDNGKLGKIVVTDLFNKGMPLIRYDTGDLGSKSISEIDGIKCQILNRVEGRRMDTIYNTKGELISSFNITNGMWDYSELLQYQFIQKTNKEYIFKLNAPDGFLRESELRSDFKKILGNDAVISFEYVEEIPLLSSGKRKKVVSLIN